MTIFSVHLFRLQSFVEKKRKKKKKKHCHINFSYRNQMKGFCSFLNIVACHFNNDQIKSCFFLACALFMYICSVRKSLRSLNVSGPGPLREFLFRNFILVRLSQVDVSVWCIMINSAQVSPPLRQVRIDVLQTKAIHQLCVSGFEESVPNHALLLGSVVTTAFCATPQEINARYSRSMSCWKAT